MPPKAKIAAPIDRPLSKAYVREFTGWATAEPPGISDPTSLRIMENVQINRDGSARIRPGLRYLSYTLAPELGQEVFPYGSTWSYLVVPAADTADRSGVDFDDSAWLTGPGAFVEGVAVDPTITVLTIPGRAATRTRFVTLVDLSDMSDAWWATVEGDGDNIRVQQAGVDVPTDVVAPSIDTVAKTGILYFRADLGTTDNVFEVKTIAGGAAVAATAPTGRNAVWADYQRVFDGWELLDRCTGIAATLVGTATLSNGWLECGTGGHATLDLAQLLGTSGFSTTRTMSAVARFDAPNNGALQTIFQHNGISNRFERFQIHNVAPEAGRVHYENDFSAGQFDLNDPGVGSIHRYHGCQGSITVGTKHAFVNGVQTGAPVSEGSRTTGYDFPTELLGIGGSVSQVPPDQMKGGIRTAYLRAGMLSAGWIADEHASWGSPSTFYTLGAGDPGAGTEVDWTDDTQLWIRHELTDIIATWAVKVMTTGGATVYVNGTEIGSAPATGIIEELTFDVPLEVLNVSTNVIAIVASATAGEPSWLDASLVSNAGFAVDRPLVGTHEAFYLNDGTKAYLLAVREEDETVGFRVLVLDVNTSAMYELTDPLIDFELRQPVEILNFTAETTYVKYLQIDNKIFALSDNGEPMRVFSVGAFKEAKALTAITRPEWENDDKLTVVHPDSAWVFAGEPDGTRRNRIPNPSFEENLDFWNAGSRTALNKPAAPAVDPVSGSRAVRVTSKPLRTNLACAPLHDVATYGITGWTPLGDTLSVVSDGDWAKVNIRGRLESFFARSMLWQGVDAQTRYKVALTFDTGPHVDPVCRIRFFGVTGVQVGENMPLEVDVAVSDSGGFRWVSKAIDPPRGAVSARLDFGAHNNQKEVSHIRFKHVVLVPNGESTAIFSGDSGTDYFWIDGENLSGSVYHPPASVSLTSDKVPVASGIDHVGSTYVEAETTVRNVELTMRLYNKNEVLVADETSGPVADTTGTPVRVEASSLGIPANATLGDLRLVIPDVARGEHHWVDAVMLESHISVADTYFDGSTADVPTAHHEWLGKKHASASRLSAFTLTATIPPAETPTVDTLVATGGPSVNTFSFAFFYTFSNEVGESAASKLTVKRASRAWSTWRWETPNAAGEPSGTETENPALAADQLVAYMPEAVFDEAMAQGATAWHLYMATWSDQDAAPVVASKVATRTLAADADYDANGWLQVTPLANVSDPAPFPTEANRYNYSNPSRGGQGLVASDRMILVYDPTEAAVIRWSSNQLGEYTNFTATKGGGFKTLTSGNLFVPAAVKLWQNPQSADTICILCLGTDGQSSSYYMAPAQIASQSEALNVMGFEETTATPGTTSPYGVEIFNNSMYHPLDDQLMKSTASNYNINHKSMTDLIRDRWEKLANKEKIISSQHDNRLYYIVNNPYGEIVEEGYNGNEIWVFDAQAKNGNWSRFLIPAHSLRKIEFGGQIYMSVIRPDGLYYLDPEYGFDDAVDPNTQFVLPTGIAWALESNTQGANRAHDAWCHLQQMSIHLGYFQGRMRYGLRGVDRHGREIDKSKVVRDEGAPDVTAFDIQDFLEIKRDMMEWFFYAESITDDEGLVVPSYGQISLVQYRYAPISVNVGYGLGSVETFEYGRDEALAISTTTDNGIPLPHLDSRRP